MSKSINKTLYPLFSKEEAKEFVQRWKIKFIFIFLI